MLWHSVHALKQRRADITNNNWKLVIGQGIFSLRLAPLNCKGNPANTATPTAMRRLKIKLETSLWFIVKTVVQVHIVEFTYIYFECNFIFQSYLKVRERSM